MRLIVGTVQRVPTRPARTIRSVSHVPRVIAS